jgi:hypothetical protein
VISNQAIQRIAKSMSLLMLVVVSIGIVVVGILQRTSEGQEKDLEKFLQQVFEKDAISTEIG